MWEKTKQIFLDSVERTLAAIADFVPALLPMLLLLLVTTLAALLVRYLLRRLFTKAKLDQRLRAWGLAAPASQGHADPSVSIARLVFWTLVALGFVVGFGAFAASGELGKRLLGYVPSALAGLAVFVVGLAGARAIERSVLIGAVNANLQSARLLGLGARWLVVVLATAMALEQLGVGGTILIVAFSFLFGGIVVALAMAVGVGARATVARSLERAFPVAPDVIQERAKKSPEQEAEYRHM